MQANILVNFTNRWTVVYLLEIMDDEIAMIYRFFSIASLGQSCHTVRALNSILL